MPRLKRVITLIAIPSVMALAALAFPAGSAARIVIGQGMFGSSLGDPQSSVDDPSNPPDSKRTLDTGLTEGQTYDVWRWGVTTFSFCCSPDRDDPLIFSMVTKDPKERTARGVGVGTTLKTLRRKVSREQCSGSSCTVFGPGRVYTTFDLNHKKRVVRVTVAAMGE